MSLIWVRLERIVSWWLLDLLVFYQVALKHCKNKSQEGCKEEGERVMSRFMVKKFFTERHRSLLTLTRDSH